MPVHHCIVHLIAPGKDGLPAPLQFRNTPLAPSHVIENMILDLIGSFNGTPGKIWGLFHPESDTYPFRGWLQEYCDGDIDFIGFSQAATAHLSRLMAGSGTSGGYVLFAHLSSGPSDYLLIAVLQSSEGVAMNDELEIIPSTQLDLSRLQMAARINLSHWQAEADATHYISAISPKSSSYFQDFLGCQKQL